MEGLQIRKATLEDKTSVLAINDNVYDGMDYLKALYEDDFINSSNTKSYVATFNGNIIGFAAGTVVDDGHTVISRAGRINKEYANKGFYKILKNYVSNNSGAAIDAFTATDTNPAIKKSSFQQHNCLISTKTFSLFDLKSEVTRLSSLADDQQTKPNQLTQDLLGEYFKADDYRKYLFPDGRIIVYWLPYRILSSNIPLFWTRDDHCHRVTDLRHEDGEVKGLLSILTTLEGVSGVLVCSLDVFGTDIESLKGHLMSHFKFLTKYSERDKSLQLIYDPQLGNTCRCVQEVCEELGILKLQWSIDNPEYFTTVCLFERRLSTNT